MASSQQNSRQLGHFDRCFNPFNIDAHKGKNLRKVSNAVLALYQDIHKSSKICDKCRKKIYSNTCTESLNEPLPGNENDSDIDSEIDHIAKKPCYSREEQLEQLLDGLKNKFASLEKNDPLRVSILTISPDCWSLRQIATEFNTSLRQASNARKLKEANGVLGQPLSKTGKKLSDETIKEVVQFYEADENSRVMPNKKDVVSLKIDGHKMYIPKRLLLSDIKVLHTEFKTTHPENPIGLTKFAELQTKHCVFAGAQGTHSVCVCTIHQNFKAMVDAVNIVKKSDGSIITGKDYKDCFDFVLCSKPKPSCYFNDCTSCLGFDNFSDYITTLLETEEKENIIFSTWESSDRCTLRKHCLEVEEFVMKLCNDLRILLPHHFIAKNQSKTIKDLKNQLKENEVLLLSDFAENYAYVAQDAAQAFHYNNDQCSVHTIIFYYKCKGRIEHCSAILLSPCTTHDAAAVYIMQQNLIPLIKKCCPDANKIIYFTDGAKQHYKNRYQMANLVNHKDDFNLIAEWHFHATAHGKGPCDGLRAILKKEATRVSLQAKPEEAILDSQAFYNWAKNKFASIKFFYYDKSQHDRTKRFLAKRFSNAPAVPKIQSGHAFIVTPGKQLQVYRYSGALEILSSLQY